MFPEGRALEFLIAAVVALVVVGPKDLPILMRRFGQFMAKLRGMAAEFRASFDEMARQSELDDLRREVEAMRRGQFTDPAASATQAEIHKTFQDIHQTLTNPETPATPAMGFSASEVSATPVDYPPPAPPPPEPAAEAAPPAPRPRAGRARKTAVGDQGAAPKPASPRRKAAAKAKPPSEPQA